MFDGRGIGNGWPLPAGPLRERARRDLAAPRAETPPRFVLVNGRWPAPPAPRCPRRANAASRPTRALGGAVALADWAARRRRDAATRCDALRGRPLLAAAGIGDPERFFAMLEAGA